MSKPVIQVENLGKLYRLGLIGTKSLSHDINRWWYRVRGREDPYLKIGQVNDRTTKGDSEYIWALKDISFEVREGEVLGIIGSNGAGKSTLLKILSRVTTPTTGKVKVRGRVASLLEIGTGFHPEMTGRENIFLNGSILGMRKGEIQRKLDEIIDFSGCEKYIDTPVKRYSSGMYVRLAFAVAAHLEPEILIVDEVLAVGDAAFQKKCLGRMGSIASEGRTVLFVSHNMAAITTLCTDGILLNMGQIMYRGSGSDLVMKYLDGRRNTCAERRFERDRMPGDDRIQLAACQFVQEDRVASVFDINKDAKIVFDFVVHKKMRNLIAGINAYNAEGICLFSSADWRDNNISPGRYTKYVILPGRLFAEGLIYFLLQLVSYDPDIRSMILPEALAVEAVDSVHSQAVRGHYKENWPGVMRVELPWSKEELV